MQPHEIAAKAAIAAALIASKIVDVAHVTVDHPEYGNAKGQLQSLRKATDRIYNILVNPT